MIYAKSWRYYILLNTDNKRSSRNHFITSMDFVMWCISSRCVTFLVILAQQSCLLFLCFFFPFLFYPTAFPDLNKKHKTLQPGKFHMSQVKASAVQQKGWLSSSPRKTWSFTLSTSLSTGVDENCIFFVCLQSSSDLFHQLPRYPECTANPAFWDPTCNDAITGQSVVVVECSCVR